MKPAKASPSSIDSSFRFCISLDETRTSFLSKSPFLWMDLKCNYSAISLAISVSTSPPGKVTTPVLDTRNFPSKFQVGSRLRLAFMKNFQISEAPGPVTRPSFIKMPGKFLDAAKALISASVSNSCPPNSRLGKPRMTREAASRSSAVP